MDKYWIKFVHFWVIIWIWIRVIWLSMHNDMTWYLCHPLPLFLQFIFLRALLTISMQNIVFFRCPFGSSLKHNKNYEIDIPWKRPPKSTLISFWLRAAPKSWSRYTTYGIFLFIFLKYFISSFIAYLSIVYSWAAQSSDTTSTLVINLLSTCMLLT